MYGVEFLPMSGEVLKGISTDMGKRVVLQALRVIVHAEHLKARLMIAHSTTAGPAVEVEQSGPSLFPYHLTSIKGKLTSAKRRRVRARHFSKSFPHFCQQLNLLFIAKCAILKL